MTPSSSERDVSGSAGGTINQPRVTDTPEDNPSLVLWHGKDPRLQSQQIVQEAADRAYSYLSEYASVLLRG